MNFIRHALRILRIPARIAYEIDLRRRLTWMQVANKYGRSPITCPGGPVVSLTSYGKRVQCVHLAIESIGRGWMRPSRFILWLDDASLLDCLPVGIQRLEKRGLEVRLCHNVGPHAKYYPYVESLREVEEPLVTADDDCLYPRYWLKRLVEASLEYPDFVNCHKARVIVFDQNGIGAYATWELADSTAASYRHFATGVGGALYPPLLQRQLKREGTTFMDCCPKADDIWLHVQTLRAGYKVRQINKNTIRLWYIPGTQSNALLQSNVARGGNDRQIRSTYRASDIERLRTDE